MSHLRCRRLGLLLLISALLAACTNPFASRPAPTEEPEDEATPTAEPSPTPVELDETAIIEQGGFSLRYPGSWETRELSSTLMMAATSSALEASSPGDNVVIGINATPLNVLAAQHSEEDVADVEGLFDLSGAIFEAAGYQIGTPEEITLDGKEGLTAELLNGDDGAGRLIVLRLPPYMVQVSGQAAPAAWEEQQVVFEEIVESLSFFDPVIPATPTAAPEQQTSQPILITEGPEGFVLRLGGNEGPTGGRFVSARGLAAAEDGTLYVAESSQGIWMFEPDGTLLGTFGENDLNDAYDVAIGENGDLFVADYGRNAIAHFSSDGTLVKRWGEHGEGPEQFGLLSPQRIAIGPDGSIYALDSRVSTGSSANSIIRFRDDGSFIERIDLPAGSAPNDLAVDREGTIYLAETVSGTITRVDTQGQLLSTLGEGVNPEGLTVGAIDIDSRGNIYVATWNNGILKFSPGGNLLSTVGAIAEPGTIPQPGQFTLPNGIAAGPGEIIWVSDNDGEYSAITALRFPVEPVSPPAATGDEGEPAAEATPVPDDLLIGQWAATAKATSFYDDSYAPDGATGPPDVPRCLSSPNAWASATPDQKERLELEFAEPVFANRINIYQNHEPGLISRVDVVDEDGNATQVYSGTAELIDTCPFVLQIHFEPTLSRVIGVVITLDQRKAETWSEIDAVELVGLQ